MCFYIKEIETGEQYRVDGSNAVMIIQMLAGNIDEAIKGLVFFGPDAPENKYSFLEKCFKN